MGLRATTWSALAYARSVAYARSDLDLAPLDADDAAAVNAVRAGNVVVADVPGFGVLRATLAVPRGRGFQIFTDTPPAVRAEVPPPASYATPTGERESVLLALARARHEAVSGRLDGAARALGLANKRFGAADLALLATAQPVHPSLYRFIPVLDGGAPGPWTLELFGDDLAWITGLELDHVAAEAPGERRLHALWRALLLGKIRRTDPALTALGPVAAAATEEMLAAVAQPVLE
ncbi:MAG: hypothetical protein KIT31_26190 [Deltaproteobacteria bacterium]|nr:hypothetical protein [Deltaproteobacteria bacterium]